MSGYFEKNLELLQSVNPNLAARIGERHFAGAPRCTNEGWEVRVISSRSGAPVIELAHESGKAIALSSRYEPSREAAHIIEKQLPDIGDKNFFAVIGFGMGYHVEELLSRIPPESTVVIAEASEDIFYLAMVARDLSAILTHPKLAIAASENVE